MKRKLLSAAVILMMFTVSACGSRESLLLEADDYELNTQSGKTSKGIAVGDDFETFLNAYDGYDIFTVLDDGSFVLLDPKEASPTDTSETLLPTFYIDGNPLTIDQICKQNKIKKSSLIQTISSTDYLSDHTVGYYSRVFDWENGNIIDIRSEYLDFNEDAVYYEELK